MIPKYLETSVTCRMIRRIYFGLFARGKRHMRDYSSRLKCTQNPDSLNFSLGKSTLDCKKAEMLANKKTGQHLSIILSGPSAGITTKDLKNEDFGDILCVNGSGSILPPQRKISYYHVVDHAFLYKDWKRFVDAAVRADHILLTTKVINHLLLSFKLEELPRNRIVHVDSFKCPYKQSKRNLANEQFAHTDSGYWFSTNLSKGIFLSPTVAYSALQIGISLGYKTLFIHGLDLTNSGRSYDKHARDQSLDEHWTRICQEMKLVAKVADSCGVQLLNMNPDSRLGSEIIRKSEAPAKRKGRVPY